MFQTRPGQWTLQELVSPETPCTKTNNLLYIFDILDKIQKNI